MMPKHPPLILDDDPEEEGTAVTQLVEELRAKLKGATESCERVETTAVEATEKRKSSRPGMRAAKKREEGKR